ncbi:MAG: LysE family transporter [Candidatus Krumholzibacteriota bacterium]
MIESVAVGFVMGWVGSMPLAGAVSIFVFQRGLAGHFRRGLVLASGAAVAEAAWCLIAVVGAEQILSRWPNLEGVAKSVGGIILLALGIYFLRSRNSLPTPDDDSVKELDTPDTLLREFWLGFVLVAGNISIPFTWLAMITVAVSLGFDPVAGPPWIFSVAVAAGIMGWFTVLLKLLGAFRARFRPSAHELLMKAMGFLLIAVGLFTLVRAWF